jgi:hypothetical protein
MTMSKFKVGDHVQTKGSNVVYKILHKYTAISNSWWLRDVKCGAEGWIVEEGLTLVKPELKCTIKYISRRTAT